MIAWTAHSNLSQLYGWLITLGPDVVTALLLWLSGSRWSNMSLKLYKPLQKRPSLSLKRTLFFGGLWYVLWLLLIYRKDCKTTEQQHDAHAALLYTRACFSQSHHHHFECYVFILAVTTANYYLWVTSPQTDACFVSCLLFAKSKASSRDRVDVLGFPRICASCLAGTDARVHRGGQTCPCHRESPALPKQHWIWHWPASFAFPMLLSIAL